MPESRSINDSDPDHYEFWNKYIFGNNNQFTLSTIDRNRNFKPKNARLYKWLKQLHNFTEWHLLRWTCTHDRGFEEDLRNQLMHNLRGTDENAVIQYLIGYSDEVSDVQIKNKTVCEIYQEFVKTPFIIAFNDLGLPPKNSGNKIETELKEIANELN